MSTAMKDQTADRVLDSAILPSPTERWASGKARRKQTPRDSQGLWRPPAKRADPVALLEQSSKSRIPELVPIRFGRMLASPFAFLRGSAIVMAHDLAATPCTGMQVQLCGDAHLANFGVYASPERNLLFDLNDFDETLPGPWECDVKRLATSFVVAGRSYNISASHCREAAAACAFSYRRHMRFYSEMSLLDVWYSRVDAEAALKVFRRSDTEGADKPLDLEKARRRNRLQALSKLVAIRKGQMQIVDNPPLVHHVPDTGLKELLRRMVGGYCRSLQEDRRWLVERYRLVDFALKVVGVGSVGTHCYIVLLDSCHHEDPLLLQVKEARASVLEALAGRARSGNFGFRVVTGQRLMQSSSDIFLGWTCDGGRDFYVRQLRDMKGAANLEAMNGTDLIDYAGLCGWVLARAHARSGDPAALAGYMGKNDEFDEAIARFAEAYADQTDRDFEAFKAAVKQGRIPATPGI
jgi:uncharacterized protein (DUF2252 family)